MTVVRACIAMAYPGSADENADPRLDVIPGDGTQPSLHNHGDLHMGNGKPHPDSAICPTMNQFKLTFSSNDRRYRKSLWQWTPDRLNPQVD